MQKVKCVASRVVSPEISSGKFPEIYSNLSGNFRKISGNFYFLEISGIFLLKNTVETFQITVYLFTSLLYIDCYSTSVH